MKHTKWLMIVCLLSATLPNLASAQQQAFLGQMKYFAGNFAPRGWAFCSGQLLPISQYTALFSLLGTTYGGDGRTTFGLPDMRGRALMHAGNGPGLTDRRQGIKLGSETETMTTAMLPQHNHSVNITIENADSANPASAGIVNERLFKTTAPNVSMHTDSISATGGSLPMNNVQPALGINCIIALTGTYPTRP